MLSARPYSRGELVRKLVDKGEDRDMAELVADWLEELKYLDDVAYAAEVVRHYSGKGYGLARVKNELYRHRVPRELWDDALDEFPDMGDAIDELLRRRLRGVMPDRAELRKSGDYLRRRGFDWDDIKSALTRYVESVEYEETDDEYDEEEYEAEDEE